MTQHLDDFTLLRYVAGDLDASERTAASEHLDACAPCKATHREIEELDEELKAIAQDPSTRLDFEVEELPEEDPFLRRPRRESRMRRPNRDTPMASALEASEEGGVLSGTVLSAIKGCPEDLQSLVDRLDLTDLSYRFALLYGLQEAGKRISEAPYRILRSAESLLEKLRRDGPSADRIVPEELLNGQIHQLAGSACLWTGEYDKAGTHLHLAYEYLGTTSDDTSLAVVELFEAQRRSFLGRGNEGLALARRSFSTFELFEMRDYMARARVVIGLALFDLGKYQEAVESYRLAIPTFESEGLWANYVGAVNSVATALERQGNLDGARREFARALKRVSRERDRAFVAAIRKGLAEVLFSAKRYREAAIASSQAGRLYGETKQLYFRLWALLFEIESWARAGEADRACHRLDLFRSEVARLGALDGSICRNIESALKGERQDFAAIALLRTEASETLKERLLGA